MENPNSQIAARLQQANNILVTVSNNPSVDQLSSAIGLTLLLNKLGKHAVAVFSGNVPSTLEFLQPEKTFEKTTDSLRDFIIALDKSKADKLRYKVENQMVKIFITPYHTSISEQDLEFSQGDFNVEVVVALGVNEQKDLDQAIVSHGRILHDATVISINTGGNSNLGSINWTDGQASSLAEMVVSLSSLIKPDALDGQMATAFLTGIVAETNRFSNNKTSSATMQISSQLMSAGANQQLIATQLEKPADKSPVRNDQSSSDGSLEIAHESNEGTELPEPQAEQINITEEGEIGAKEEDEKEAEEPKKPSGRGMTLQPPSLGSKLSANIEPEALDPSTDPLGVVEKSGPILSHEPSKSDEPKGADTPDTSTLADLEKSVQSPHLEEAIPESEAPKPVDTSDSDLVAARDAVKEAVQTIQTPSIELSNRVDTQPGDLDLSQLTKPAGLGSPPSEQAHESSAPLSLPGQPTPPAPVPLPQTSATSEISDLPLGLVPTTPPIDNTATKVTDPTAPPPVPPPFLPDQQPPPGGPPQNGDEERPLAPPIL